MEFCSSLHQSGPAANRHNNVECEDIYKEDDGFYMDIRERLILLIAEGEDEDFPDETKTSNSSTTTASQRGWSDHFMSELQHGSSTSSLLNNPYSSSVTFLPTINLRSGKTGTGVFIPQIVTYESVTRPGMAIDEQNSENKKRAKMQ
ncbi:hypothetical protein Tsubulata_018572 [Turnera subulata]|uniref:Uncharacterized protein n=1 Tax=Turnera subulata TaxID=218843 RepID=A0A9Q0G4M6_9ROSI|nr:hypothetical protein Tsubulata_018572 [Turnera subulata]